MKRDLARLPCRHLPAGNATARAAAGCVMCSGVPVRCVAEALGGVADGVKFITGTGGFVLDEIKPDARRVATALRNGIGAMPSFRDKRTEARMRALAACVSKASGGAP